MTEKILELLNEYAPDWQAEETIGGYKLTKDELSIRFLEIEKKYGDYHSRLLFYSGGEVVYTQRTNISSDKQIEFDLQLFKEYKEYEPAIKHVRHALHRQADEMQEEAKEETLDVFDGEQSLDLENWPIETEREVVAGFAVKNGYTHLFGDAGVGKSILAHNIGLHAASDQRYLGFHAFLQPIKVLYLSLEMFYDEFRERHNKLLEYFPESAKENFLFLCPESFDITNARDRSLLGNTVDKYGIKFVIVDSHTDWRGEVDLNDNAGVGAEIILPTQKLLKQKDFSLLLLDHTGWKGERPAGAKVVWNKASIGILMEADSTGENLTKISFKKWRNTARKRPRPISLTYDPDTYLINLTSESALVDLSYKIHLPAEGAEITAQIMSLLGIKDRQARTKIAEMVRGRLLMKRGSTYFPVRTD